jgi:hypothetical protein
MNFGEKRFTIRNTQKRENLNFECYILLNEELQFFEVDFQQDKFKILWLFP